MQARLRASAEPRLPTGVAVRRLTPDDTHRLATLMVVAYAGTVDDHGQSREFHETEAQRTIAGDYGEVQWAASLLAHTKDEECVGATVVTRDRGHLLAFALVVPEWRNRGLGGALLVRSGNRLLAEGATHWTLAVTVGNPAQRLYERLGFCVDHSL
jgi:GNAT superfamily N-acetyltransferase